MATNLSKEQKLLSAVQELHTDGDVEILCNSIDVMFEGFLSNPYSTSPIQNHEIHFSKKVLRKFLKRLKKINKKE